MGTIMYPTKLSPRINRITKYPNKETRHTVIPLKRENKSTFLSKKLPSPEDCCFIV